MGATSSKNKIEGRSVGLHKSSFRTTASNHRRGSSVGTRVSGATVFGSDADLGGRNFTIHNSSQSKSSLMAEGQQDFSQEMEEGKAYQTDHSDQTDTEHGVNKPGHLRHATMSFRTEKKLDELEEQTPGSLRTLPISLLDGTMWALRYSLETDKFRHGMIRLKRSQGLEKDGAFSMFVLHDGLLNGVMMPVSDDGLIQEEVGHWKAEDQLADYLYEGGGLQRSKHLVIRRRVYFSNSAETHEALLAQNVSSMAHTLAFIDATYQFRRGWYHHNREQLVEASALLYQALHLHSDTDKFDKDMCVADCIPPICVRISPDLLQDLLQSVHAMWRGGINKLTDIQCEQVFCQQLSKWNPWYGSIIFSVSECEKVGIRKYLTATQDGVYILTRDETDHLSSIVMERKAPWASIKDWQLDTVGETISITTSAPEAKNNGPRGSTWQYGVKPGNGVSIVDQLIEYSCHSKKGGKDGEK